MSDLPRLKPVPIPAIHPVPEYAATGELAAMYERTKAGFGVPWMGVVAMAFAHYPTFYGVLWSAMEPMVRSQGFADACRSLRECAEAEAAALTPPSMLPRLRELGYGAAEIDEIRACNEIFSAGNMPYLLLATRGRMLLEGLDWPAGGDPGPEGPRVQAASKPPLIERHHADPTMAALYDDIRRALGLPFVNTDYRAFARWPSYFAPAWTDLRGAVTGPGYEERLVRVHNHAVTLAGGFPNVTGVGPTDLIAATDHDASADEVRDVVRLFQWLLPGLAVNVAFLRAALITE